VTSYNAHSNSGSFHQTLPIKTLAPSLINALHKSLTPKELVLSHPNNNDYMLIPMVLRIKAYDFQITFVLALKSVTLHKTLHDNTWLFLCPLQYMRGALPYIRPRPQHWSFFRMETKKNSLHRRLTWQLISSVGLTNSFWQHSATVDQINDESPPSIWVFKHSGAVDWLNKTFKCSLRICSVDLPAISHHTL